MIFKIYDWKNKAKEIDVGDREINSIKVEVITGDEIITINFNDGTSLNYDSSNVRNIDYYDGEYSVNKDNLDKWINYKMYKNTSTPISYKRIDYMKGITKEAE